MASVEEIYTNLGVKHSKNNCGICHSKELSNNVKRNGIHRRCTKSLFKI